jgi:hypothetical protein
MQPLETDSGAETQDTEQPAAQTDTGKLFSPDLAPSRHGDACWISVYLGECAKSVLKRAIIRLGLEDRSAKCKLAWIVPQDNSVKFLNDEVSRHMYIYIYTYIHICIYTCSQIRACTCYTNTYIHVFTNICIHMFTSTYIHVFTNAYICMLMNTYIHMLILSSCLCAGSSLD